MNARAFSVGERVRAAALVALSPLAGLVVGLLVLWAYVEWS